MTRLGRNIFLQCYGHFTALADVVEFTDLLIAREPQFRQSLRLKETMACLDVFASSSGFSGLIITEFNHDHAVQEGSHAVAFINGPAEALVGKSPSLI